LSSDSDDGVNFKEFVSQPAGYSNFFRNFGIPAPPTPETSLLWSLKTPGQHHLIMVRQAKKVANIFAPYFLRIPNGNLLAIIFNSGQVAIL